MITIEHYYKLLTLRGNPMKNEQFYEFVKTIAGDDQMLSESVIAAHRAVYDPDSLTEGRLRDLAKAGLLAGSLATSAFAGGGEAPSPEENQKQAIEFVQEIQNEYLDEMDMDDNDAYKQATQRYEELLNIDQKSANHFARVINMNIHNKLGIAPPIGKQQSN